MTPEQIASGLTKAQRDGLQELGDGAALLPAPQEPVAWMYSMEGREPVFLREKLRGDVLRGDRGWTETPLYAGPKPPAGAKQ